MKVNLSLMGKVLVLPSKGPKTTGSRFLKKDPDSELLINYFLI